VSPPSAIDVHRQVPLRFRGKVSGRAHSRVLCGGAWVCSGDEALAPPPPANRSKPTATTSPSAVAAVATPSLSRPVSNSAEEAERKKAAKILDAAARVLELTPGVAGDFWRRKLGVAVSDSGQSERYDSARSRRTSAASDYSSDYTSATERLTTETETEAPSCSVSVGGSSRARLAAALRGSSSGTRHQVTPSRSVAHRRSLARRECASVDRGCRGGWLAGVLVALTRVAHVHARRPRGRRRRRTRFARRCLRASTRRRIW
jgi:hypothetical protein